MFLIFIKVDDLEIPELDTASDEVDIVRSLSAKYRPDRYRRDKSVKFGTELP